MSATNRGAVRVENDLYSTPGSAIDKLVVELDRPRLGDLVMLEPCEGEKAITIRAGWLFKSVEWAEISRGRDYLAREYSADVCITNPPYSLAQEVVEKTLVECDTVAHLLRLNFLGSQERRDWWQGRRPSHLFVLSERPAFVDICKGVARKGEKRKGCGRSYPRGTGGRCECGGAIGKGTDATEYAWFVWDHLGLVQRDPGVYVL